MREQVQLGLLPGMDVVVPSSQEEPAGEVVEGEALQILLEMFMVIQKGTGQDARACWNQLVRLLADCARVHPMLEEDHRVAGRLMPLAQAFFTSFYGERKEKGHLPWDPLGAVLTHVGAGDEHLGQHLTPRFIVQYINDSTVGTLLKREHEGGSGDGEEVEEGKALYPSGQHSLTVIDPCCGTGRFLLDLVERYAHRVNLALFGVELDRDLYRACLVNMRLWGADFVCPYFLLRADALLCDLRMTSPNWLWANRWAPPNSEEAFRLAPSPDEKETPAERDGLTWEEYRRCEAGEELEIDWELVAGRARPSYLVPRLISTFFNGRDVP